ncbi:MAG: DUF4062 domain-containing protein [Sphingomonadales bacterium]
MPRQILAYDVFVSSPSDVQKEREIVDTTIRHWNRKNNHELRMRFEPLLWEIDAIPGIGDSPQEVINQQIGNNYDIYLGILGATIGTPTKKSPSGTIEEYEKALEKFKVEGNPWQILFYIKKTNVDLETLNLVEAKKVQDLIARLKSDGVLYAQFSDETNLRQILDMHLTKIAPLLKKEITKEKKQQVKKISKKNSTAVPKEAKKNKNLKAPPKEEEELGLLDYFNQVTENSTKNTKILQKISTHIEEITLVTNTEVKIIEMAGTGSNFNAKAIYASCKKIAYSYTKTAQYLEDNQEQVFDYLDGMIEGVRGIFENAADFNIDEKELKDTLEGILGLKKGMLSAADGFSKFEISLASIPKITKDMNSAKTKLINNLKIFREKLISTGLVIDEIFKQLKNYKKK